MRNQIKDKISKLSTKFGGFENIALMREAYHGCYPSRPFGWDCNAVRIDGNKLEIGKVQWDFDQDLEDPSDYDWTFGQSDFVSIEEYDLTDDDELEDALNELRKW